MADFSPYQDSPDETRIPSTTPATTTRTLLLSPSLSPYPSPSLDPSIPNFHRHYTGHGTTPTTTTPSTSTGGRLRLPLPLTLTRREEMDMFSTRLGLRMDIEAIAAYLCLPPLGAVGLLVWESRSDYVRFHAWQAALAFTVLAVLAVVASASWWTLGLVAGLALALAGAGACRAWGDAETLDRWELPLFGSLASSILDDE